MKTAIIATIASLAGANKSDFPSMDMFHASCKLETTLNYSCDTLFSDLTRTLSNFNDPSKGIYEIKENSSNDYIWVTRTTPVKHYVDDILLEISGNTDSCTIQSKSRSQSMSYYDFNTNYCNMYNIFRSLGTSFSSPKNSNCKFVPDDANTTCN